jgi:cytochrome P450
MTTLRNQGCPIPVAEPKTGLKVLRAFREERSPLAALRILRDHLGHIFQIALPGFRPIVLSGPKYNRFLLVSGRKNFHWRTEGDPVTGLLRHGVLVEDGERHDFLRTPMDAALSRKHVMEHYEVFWQSTDAVTSQWGDGATVDMLVEMRKIALLILMQSLFGVDFRPHLETLFDPVIKVIKYISPGAWLIWNKFPRLGYHRAIEQVDAYLYSIIRERRASPNGKDDLLTQMINDSQWSDDLIRDQLLTLLIAGHDTSTALLAWTLYLLGKYPESLAQVQEEVESNLGAESPTNARNKELRYLDLIIKETLRLYPPIHMGNRKSATEISLDEYRIPKDSRVMYSIYLTHRDPEHWPDPESFKPERFDRSEGQKPAGYTYLPFGGGPRACVGAAFAQIEAKTVLARLLQTFDLELLSENIHPHMGATLEPHPGVQMRVHRRSVTS